MAQIPSEKMEAIQALREAGFSKTSVVEMVGVRRETVNDHEGPDAFSSDNPQEYADKTFENADEALPDHIDRRLVLEDEWLPDDVTEKDTAPADRDPFETEEEEKLKPLASPGEASPGEWLESFFNDLEVGIKSKFITLQSRRADRRDELPTEERMLADLREMASGASGQEAAYIAEEYWAAVQDYLKRSTTEATGMQSVGGRGGDRDRDDFVSAQRGQQGQGEWVTMPDGSRQFGTFRPDGQGGKQFVPMQPPGQPQQYGAPSQQNQEAQAIREEMRELRREMSDDSGGGLRDQIQEFIELRQAMQQLQEEDAEGADEWMQMLRQELRALRSELNQQAGGSADDDPRDRLLNRLVSADQVDPNTVMDAFERIEGQTSPEIREKEIEMELEERKMQQKQEQQERLLSSVESLVETGATAIAEKLRESPDNGGRQQAADGAGTATDVAANGQQAPTGRQPEAAAPSPAQPEGWTCPECGTETPQDPALDGRRCNECDYSRVPCPDCQHPIEIPPEEDRERGGCPDCGEFVPLPEELSGKASCLSCDWIGDAEDAVGELVQCDGCGAEHPVGPDPEAAR